MIRTASDPGVYTPAGGKVLLGPMLTEREFANSLGVSARRLRRRPYLLRISGPLAVGPAYPAFHLDGEGLRLDIAFIALLLRRRVTDLEACDWLVRSNEELGRRSPIGWLNGGGALRILAEVMPMPTRAAPAGGLETDLGDVRQAWLSLRTEIDTPGRTIAWERISAGRGEAYPLGV